MSSVVCAKLLILFGAIILMAAALSGIGLWRAILKKQSRETVYAWRNAVVLPGGTGTLMLALTAVRPVIYLGEVPDTLLVWSLATSGTAFAMAWPVAAITGQHGLKPGGSLANWYVFGGNVFGFAGALLGIVIILAGAIHSAKDLLQAIP